MGFFTRCFDYSLEHQRHVLNAFRHHGILHPNTDRANGMLLLCSTPFGIMGFFTSINCWAAAARSGAQRLSASWDSSLWSSGLRLSREGCAQRLSASWDSSRAVLSAGGSGGGSAQRLSASWDSSPAAVVRHVWRQGCSTPFGIMGFFTGQRQKNIRLYLGAQRLSASWDSSRL